VELVTKKRLTIVSGRVNRELAEEVAQRLGLGLGPLLAAVSRRLQALQQGVDPGDGPLPQLGAPQG
jgi:hypothetical protein